MWQHWTNLLLGVIIVAASFTNLVNANAVWTFGVLGGLVMIASLAGLLAVQSEHQMRHA